MAKGRADYLLILDVDELLVPRSSYGYRNLPALIAEADTKPVKTFSFIGSEVSHEVGLGVLVGIGNLILLSPIYAGHEQLERRAGICR